MQDDRFGSGAAEVGGVEMDAKGEDELIKSLIGFPTAWTAHDFLSGRDWWLQVSARLF